MGEYDALNCYKETGARLRALAKVKGVNLVELLDRAEKLLLAEASPEEKRLTRQITQLDEKRDQ